METFFPGTSLDDRSWVRIPFPAPAYLTLSAAGDMKRDGDDRRALYASTNLDPATVHVAEQTHSREVAVISGPQPSDSATRLGERFHPGVDGLLAPQRHSVLAVTVADCVPVFLCDRRTGARGLLHSGWRGTGILENAITTLTDLGSQTRDLVVTLGPCISAESYEVDDGRAAAFEDEWGASSVRRANGRSYLDLHAANQEICRRNGVGLVNVVRHCTFRTPAMGSYRRDGAQFRLMLAILADEQWELTSND